MSDDDRIKRVEQNLEQLAATTARLQMNFERFVASQDETEQPAPDWPEVGDVCDECQAKREFIETYVLHNAPSARDLRDWSKDSGLNPYKAAEDTVIIAVAMWDAIQNATEGCDD